jgi:hypothetical protein
VVVTRIAYCSSAVTDAGDENVAVTVPVDGHEGTSPLEIVAVANAEPVGRSEDAFVNSTVRSSVLPALLRIMSTEESGPDFPAVND